MKWSIKIGRLSGIDVYLHFTFLLLLAFLGFLYWRATQEVTATLQGVAFIVTLFGCVVLHELGHALMARRYGIKTRDITLLPIGGIARLEKMPEKPMQEFWVALAGPAVNVVIAAVLFAWLAATGGFAPAEEISLTGGPFWQRLMVVNIFLEKVIIIGELHTKRATWANQLGELKSRAMISRGRGERNEPFEKLITGIETMLSAISTDISACKPESIDALRRFRDETNTRFEGVGTLYKHAYASDAENLPDELEPEA